MTEPAVRPDLEVRPLLKSEYADWLPLWQGYQTFYGVTISDGDTNTAWSRFHDPSEAMFVLGAFVNGKLTGIVQFLYHRSTWTAGNYCYLQDLFTSEDARGKGVARALIEAVYRRAEDDGCSRVYWLTQEGNSIARVLYDKVASASGFVQYRKLITPLTPKD
ncbi:MAG: GNAT family N-acetyltransferase [Pseudomonadota bacterium]